METHDLVVLSVGMLANPEAGTLFINNALELDEFGYIKPSDVGELYYTSLSDSLDEEDKNFTEISNLFATNEGIYFCSSIKSE